MGPDDEKRLAAEAAAELVEAGMAVGLGTGTTVALLPAGARGSRLDIRCVATSLETEHAARELGLPVEPFDDARSARPGGRRRRPGGAGRLAREGWRRGADPREDRRGRSRPLRRHRLFGQGRRALAAAGPAGALRVRPSGDAAGARHATLRDASPTPDGGRIADYSGEVDDPAALAARLDAEPGVVSHGLFAPSLVSLVLVGRGDRVERRTVE